MFEKPSANLQEQKVSMLSEFLTKHASDSPVTFVTLMHFAFLFFPLSCFETHQNRNSVQGPTII